MRIVISVPARTADLKSRLPPAYAARSRMWQTGLGELAWFVLAGLVAYALLEVYRHWRAY